MDAALPLLSVVRRFVAFCRKAWVMEVAMQRGLPTRCGMCNHDPACGTAFINDVRYCHADSHSCYQEAQYDHEAWNALLAEGGL